MFKVAIETALNLIPTSEARFTNGTMYVECTVAEAVKLETELRKATAFGIVMERVSKSTTAFDFV